MPKHSKFIPAVNLAGIGRIIMDSEDPVVLPSDSFEFDDSFSVNDLQGLFKKVDKLASQARDRLEHLEAQSRKVQSALLARTDLNSLDVSTPQSRVYATPEGKELILSMHETGLRNYFFDCSSVVSESQKAEVYCYLRRVFPGVSVSVVERALQANRNHLAGSHLMLEEWTKAGCPDKFSWRPMHAEKETRFRMAWPFEDHGKRVGVKRKDALESLIKPLSTPLLLELQFVHVRRDWIERRGLREQQDKSKKNPSRPTGKIRQASNLQSRPPMPSRGRSLSTLIQKPKVVRSLIKGASGHSRIPLSEAGCLCTVKMPVAGMIAAIIDGILEAIAK